MIRATLSKLFPLVQSIEISIPRCCRVTTHQYIYCRPISTTIFAADHPFTPAKNNTAVVKSVFCIQVCSLSTSAARKIDVIVKQSTTSKAQQTKRDQSAFFDADFCFKGVPFPTFLEYLRVFQEEHGHLLVPRSFCVPIQGNSQNTNTTITTTTNNNNSKWSIEAGDFPLGLAVANTRSHYRRNRLPSKIIESLNHINFIWSSRGYRYQRAISALTIFKDLYGHCNVPQAFIVPSDTSDWPRFLWGYRLGYTTCNVRNQDSKFVPIKEAFMQLGFDMNPQVRMWPFEGVKQSLLIFHKRFGHFNVPQRYTVPKHLKGSDVQYPADMVGAELGGILQRIRAGISFTGHREELQAMGVSLASQTYNKFHDILLALKCYRAWQQSLSDNEHTTNNGTNNDDSTNDKNKAFMHIPRTFRIPANNPFFLPRQAGAKLGDQWYKIRRRFAFMEYHDQLVAEGFFTKEYADQLKEQYPQYQEKKRQERKQAKSRRFQLKSRAQHEQKSEMDNVYIMNDEDARGRPSRSLKKVKSDKLS